MESVSYSGGLPAFEHRPASQNWEQAPLPGIPGAYLWVWFKPAQAPLDVVVQIPEELKPYLASCLTLRGVFAALGLAAPHIQFASVQGTLIDPLGGANPALDQLMPIGGPWGDAAISIRMHNGAFPGTAVAPAATVMQSAGAPSAAVPASAEADQLFAAMDADWSAILLMETQLSQLRKQLNAVQGRLQSLNRDLTPDERNAADSNDVKGWQDARRFLRDASAHVSRYIREHDVGVTSAAGQRNRFEEMHKNSVAPRKPFEGMAAAAHELETYRKLVQLVLAKMQTALTNAGSNGEQRAQQVLGRVNAKMRKSR